MKLEDDNLENDTGGHYCHPEFEKFIGDREWVPQVEIDKWAAEKGIEIKSHYEEMPEDWEGDQFYDWKPEPPEGWQVLMRYDTEDAEMIAIWYRSA